jgi:CheY-like chemotaxis protein
MPFMGGMEATELIRSYEMHKSLSPTPIIALTAHASAYLSNTQYIRNSFSLFFSSDW